MYQTFNVSTFQCINLSLYQPFNVLDFQCIRLLMYQTFNVSTFRCLCGQSRFEFWTRFCVVSLLENWWSGNWWLTLSSLSLSLSLSLRHSNALILPFIIHTSLSLSNPFFFSSLDHTRSLFIIYTLNHTTHCVYAFVYQTNWLPPLTHTW